MNRKYFKSKLLIDCQLINQDWFILKIDTIIQTDGQKEKVLPHGGGDE